MAYKLIVTEDAHKDLDDALDYIVNRLSNPTAAAHMLSQVEECYLQLRTFPFLYEACHDSRLRDMGYRKTVIGNYILVFRPDEESQTVYILRYFYGARDYEKIL
ncbi:MAG: type II toxin-antitoxin system RelE/ParE family toxin [Oscillospiraceae bacterium]|nr:type II toxin-antitoxin system RelE/ParE family toxin [Oscillospiraceae bacterium]